MSIEGISAIKRHYEKGGLPRAWWAIATYSGQSYPFLTAKLRYYYRYLRGERTFHPFALYAVDPDRIARYVDWKRFKNFANAGRVLSGAWDRDANPLDSFEKFELIRRYLTGDLDAADLTYDYLREHGYHGDEATLYTEYGYGTYLNELRESISRDGVRVNSSETAVSPFARYDHVSVDIGRDGELLFDSNGFHRLAIAQTLGTETIPVRLNAVHRAWYEAHGVPDAHPELAYLTRISIPWRTVYSLETSPAELPPYKLRRTEQQ